MAKKLISKNGFTLIEVMIALAIFAIFVTAFITTQGYNLADSTRFKEELMLKSLAENKINTIITSPPDFKPSLELKKDTGTLKENEAFSYTIEYKQMKIPDISSLLAADQDEEEGTEEKADPMKKKVFDNIRKNLEKLLWQVEVTITSKESEQSYSLSTWLYNQKGEVLFEQF